MCTDTVTNSTRATALTNEHAPLGAHKPLLVVVVRGAREARAHHRSTDHFWAAAPVRLSYTRFFFLEQL